MGKYRMRPIDVEAFRWTGDQTEEPVWMAEAIARGDVEFYVEGSGAMYMTISTPIGMLLVQEGDWVVYNPVNCEMYPVGDRDFARVYEPVVGPFDGTLAEAKNMARKFYANDDEAQAERKMRGGVPLTEHSGLRGDDAIEDYV